MSTRTSARLRRGAGLGDEDVSSSPLPPASGDASRRRPRIQAVQRRGRRRARTVTSRSLRRSRARLPPFSYSRAPAPPLVAQATFARAREAVHAVHRGPPRHCFAPDPVGSVQAAATTSRSAAIGVNWTPGKRNLLYTQSGQPPRLLAKAGYEWLAA